MEFVKLFMPNSRATADLKKQFEDRMVEWQKLDVTAARA